MKKMVAFSLFGWDIYRYGIFYFISFLILYGFLFRIGKKHYFIKYPGMQKSLTVHLDSLFICLVLGVLIGGRLGHFFIYHFQDLIQNPSEVFAVWKGGMSFIGGIVGVSIALLVFKKLTKSTFQDFSFLLACILVFLPLGIFLGRLGNYLNQELYGIPFVNPGFSENIVNILKNLNFLHVYPHVDEALRINTNLLSMIFEGIFLLCLQAVSFFGMIKKKEFKPIKLIGQFVLGYSFFRFLFEYLRSDSQAEFVGIFTKSQRFFVFFFCLGIFFLIYQKKGKNVVFSL